MIGQRLGHFDVVEKLGEGGMGAVYRARDTRLGRDVAIKVLPEHLAQNPDLRQRLEREAKAVSSLNHRHICTLHDIGREGGVDFLVTSLPNAEATTLLRAGLPPKQQYLQQQQPRGGSMRGVMGKTIRYLFLALVLFAGLFCRQRAPPQFTTGL